MSSEQPLPKQSEAQDGVRWMGGKETRGVATCATAAAAGSTPAAAAAAASRGPKRRAAAAAGSTPATAAAASRGPKRRAAEQPEKHLSGFKEALKCAAQAVGATELELSVDSSGCDVLSQHNLFHLLMDHQMFGGTFEEDGAGRPMVYFMPREAAAAAVAVGAPSRLETVRGGVGWGDCIANLNQCASMGLEIVLLAKYLLWPCCIKSCRYLPSADACTAYPGYPCGLH